MEKEKIKANESRGQILDRLSMKYGQQFSVVNFEEFCQFFSHQAVFILVRQAMAEYARQYHRNLTPKE